MPKNRELINFLNIATNAQRLTRVGQFLERLSIANRNSSNEANIVQEDLSDSDSNFVIKISRIDDLNFESSEEEISGSKPE